MRISAIVLAVGSGILPINQGAAQSLPPHPPVRVLIVSDEVNPHGLMPSQLTQPGEISAALLASPVLNRDSGPEAILEIPTNQIQDATTRLLLPAGSAGSYNVLIYFAHRIPDNGMGAAARQEAFVTAVNGFLLAGGGVISFHHGIYRLPGKESILQLLGAEASGAVPWNTVDGQNVINVQPGSFITGNGVSYGASVGYAHPAFGVPAGTYALFNNTPDERYPTLNLLAPAADILPLFASNYVDNGSTHILGYVRRRADWDGAVVMYQPGEYEPNALGPGNNLQILLNAIVFAASTPRGVLHASGFEP